MHCFRPFLVAFTVLLCVATAGARDLHLIDGRVLHDITVLSKSPSEFKISHAEGVASLTVADLTLADSLELNATKHWGYSAKDLAESRAHDGTDGHRESRYNSPIYSDSSPLISGSSRAAAGSSTKASTGGPVHVRAYTKQDGTYVHEHTRSR